MSTAFSDQVGKVISVDIFRHSYKIETKDKDVIEIFQDESN